MIDEPYARCQAEVLLRIARHIMKLAEAQQNPQLLDWADHLRTEVGYLCNALGIDPRKDNR